MCLVCALHRFPPQRRDRGVGPSEGCKLGSGEVCLMSARLVAYWLATSRVTCLGNVLDAGAHHGAKIGLNCRTF